MNVYYSPSYTATSEQFETLRKAEWIAESLNARPIPGVKLVAPMPLTAEELLSAHSIAYVFSVRTGSPRLLAESSGFMWEPSVWEFGDGVEWWRP